MPSNAHVTIYFACSPKETNDANVDGRWRWRRSSSSDDSENIQSPPLPAAALYPFASDCLWLLLIRTAGRQSMRRLRLNLSCSNVTANSRERQRDERERGRRGRQTETRPRNEVIKHYGGGHQSNCAPVIACEWQM